MIWYPKSKSDNIVLLASDFFFFLPLQSVHAQHLSNLQSQFLVGRWDILFFRKWNLHRIGGSYFETVQRRFRRSSLHFVLEFDKSDIVSIRNKSDFLESGESEK